jgi:deoxyribonuclease V
MAAGAAFSGVLAEHTEVLPYRPSEFYLRELPPLRAVPLCIGGLGLPVVDGYADLDPAGRPGLGAYAHPGDRRDQVRVPPGHPRRAGLARGTSARPLFVTAGGMARTEAADLVRHLASRYRLPDALRRADMLARTGLPATTLSCHSG